MWICELFYPHGGQDGVAMIRQQGIRDQAKSASIELQGTVTRELKSPCNDL